MIPHSACQTHTPPVHKARYESPNGAFRRNTAFLSKRNRDAEEGRGNGLGFLARALVLAIEQFFELFLHISGLTVLVRRFEGIHGRPVIFSEFIRERLRGTGIVERKRVPCEWAIAQSQKPRGRRCSIAAHTSR